MRTLEKKRFDTLYQSNLENGKSLYVGNILKHSANLNPQKEALVCQGKSLSFLQWYQNALAVTKSLYEKGVKPGDRILLLFENSIEFYIAYFGILQTGAVVVPLNTFLKEPELAHIIKDAQPKGIIVGDAHYELIKNHIEHISFILREQDLNVPPVLKEEVPLQRQDDHDLAVLLYTSGTTGFPKGVMLSSSNVMTNVFQALSCLPIEFSERVFAVLPLFHSFAQIACVWASTFAGATVIVVPKITKGAILEGLRYKPTIFLGVPAFYGFLCLLKTVPVEDATLFVSGGDALPSKIRGAFAILYGRKICNAYGLTETSPLIAIDVNDANAEIGSVGSPAPYIACAIRDEKGKDLPEGEDGLLWVKGNNVMLGYYHEPELTQEIIKDGWLCTGDIAYINPKGNIVICGREKDLIIHKGLNIYPPEIENILFLHPLVINAAVVGKKDEETGEIPVAFVVLREEKKGVEAELRELCLKNLAAYKVPRTITVLPELPMTGLRKVDKKVLKKKYVDIT